MIALATFAAFIPALSGEFLNWDDERNFVSNPHYRGLGAEQLRWMWSTFLLGHYIPLSWMTLGADYSLWGMNPFGYHLTNLLLHSATAVLVYYIARRVLALAAGGADVTDYSLPAALAALLYSVHPLRVESVAWITERRDVLSGFFLLAAVLAYISAVSGERVNRRRYWAAVALFIAAVLSKATVVTAPAVLLILNVYPLRRLPVSRWSSAATKRIALELLPFAIPAAMAVVWSVVAVHPPFLESFGLSFLAPSQLEDLAANVSAQNQFGPAAKVVVSAFSFSFYLLKTFVPAGLSPLYEMPRDLDPAAPAFVAGYFGVLAVIAVCIAARRYPGVAAATAIFFIVSLPMLGVVQNGPQIAADRYTYHSAPAIAILVAALLWRFSGSPRRFVALAVVVVVALGASTWRQSGFWRNSDALWGRVLAVDSASSLGHSAMASLRYRQDRVEEGLNHSIRSLQLAPGFAEARNDYGVGLARTGRLEDALMEYRRALSLKPRFDDAENNLGVLMIQLGQPDSAIAHYRRALEINPENSDAEINWGNALVRAGSTADAIAHYRRAVHIKPTAADAFHNWGVALARDGNFREAAARFREALAVNPGHAEAREYLRLAEERLR